MADRLRRLTRRVVLFVVAVGAGFLLAALFQGPAAADGLRSGSGFEPQLEIGGLVEPVTRLTEAAHPHPDRQRAAGADDRHESSPDAPLTGAVGGVVAARDATPAPMSRRSADASPVSVPLSRVDATGAAQRERLQPTSSAHAAHRPARRVQTSPQPADPVRQPPSVAPAMHRPAGTPAPGLITAPLPHVVNIVTAPLPHIVSIVSAVPIRPVVRTLCHVTDAVLAPALDVTIVPAAPPPLAPPALRRARAPMADPPPTPTMPTPPAPAAGSAESAVAAVPAEAVPPPAVPPRMSVVGPAPPSPGASTGHLAARPDPVTAAADLPGRPVTPADQDAAGADDGSPPAPGLVWPADRQSHLGAGQPCDLVPPLVQSRAPAPIARPG
ncbi:hypothetical protein ABZU25_15640 [Micromonospora sp. NPDC005215]|uniref:hypothetical protein n=1 Tax=Micromonospora sp. NPDC005215 TaxID=3157024 RepID=UPI0033A35345